MPLVKQTAVPHSLSSFSAHSECVCVCVCLIKREKEKKTGRYHFTFLSTSIVSTGIIFTLKKEKKALFSRFSTTWYRLNWTQLYSPFFVFSFGVPGTLLWCYLCGGSKRAEATPKTDMKSPQTNDGSERIVTRVTTTHMLTSATRLAYAGPEPSRDLSSDAGFPKLVFLFSFSSSLSCSLQPPLQQNVFPYGDKQPHTDIMAVS